jgi:hypothetical protein
MGLLGTSQVIFLTKNKQINEDSPCEMKNSDDA